MRQSVNTIRKLALASLVIPIVFFVSTIVFFAINDKAYNKLGVLNFLQFNVEGIGYKLIPFICYVLAGLLFLILWGSMWKMLPKIRVASAFFMVCGLLLLYISISANQTFAAGNAFFSSIAFVVLNLIGLFALTVQVKNKISKFILFLPLLFILYQVVDRFILLNHDFNINASIVLCFAWYFYLPTLLHKEYVDYQGSTKLL